MLTRALRRHRCKPTVAANAAYEAFMTTKLSGLPEVLRLTSHLTMKAIKKS